MDSHTLNRIISSIPDEAIQLRNTGNLHKLAEARLGTTDFGIDTAVATLAKKAYYRRRVNTAIYEGLVALENSQSKG